MVINTSQSMVQSIAVNTGRVLTLTALIAGAAYMVDCSAQLQQRTMRERMSRARFVPYVVQEGDRLFDCARSQHFTGTEQRTQYALLVLNSPLNERAISMQAIYGIDALANDSVFTHFHNAYLRAGKTIYLPQMPATPRSDDYLELDCSQ